MQYCFLNSVYTDEDDSSVVYEVVVSDKNYTDVQLKRVSVQELKELAESKDYITDFSFEDCYLKCAPVKRYVIDEKIKEFMERRDGVRDYCFAGSSSSLFTLLRLGASNSFYVIADELALSETVSFNTVDGIVPFSKISFSQSSLSVFVREVYGTELRNHYLVQEVNGYLKFIPFYFLVPVNCSEEIHAQYVSTKKINNVEYKVFHAESLCVAEPVAITSQALLNKAACMHVVYDGMLKAVAALQKRYYESRKLTWVDNGTHQHRIKTVTFESSYVKLTTSVINQLIDTAGVVAGECSSVEEAMKRVAGMGLGKVKIAALSCLVNVMMVSDSVTDVVANCHQMEKIYSKYSFYNDLYLYRMKVFISVTPAPVASLLDSKLCGSNETGVTTVRRVTL